MWAPSMATAAVANVSATTVVTAATGPGVVITPPGTVTVGAPPIAVPFPIIACERNRTVSFDSTGSADADAFPAPLGRLWQLVLSPNGSAATIATPNTVTLDFVPDVGGIYELQLLVTDGGNGGPAPGGNDPLPISLDVLSAAIVPPVNPAAVGTPSGFSAGGSVLSATTFAPQFAWAVVTAPAPSALLGSTGNTQMFVFTSDVAGDYEIELVISQDVAPAGGGAPVRLRDTDRLTITV
jgi:hypothetical protein